MSQDARLSELFRQWQQLRAKGNAPSVEELCADAPELIEPLSEQIRSAEKSPGQRSTENFLDPDVATAPMTDDESPSLRPELTVSSASRYGDLTYHDRGGLGEVFRARDEDLRRSVALKFINIKHLDDAERVHSFRTEAEITSRLDHPGVVPVYGIGENWDGRPFYVMRFIRGKTLEEAIEEFHASSGKWNSHRRHVELQRLLRNFVSVCNTVAYAHNRGIIHRDIKPQNIMLGPYGETLVVDWGLAMPYDRDARAKESGEQTLRLSSDSVDSASSGSGQGTPAYMSPEQMPTSYSVVGPSADIFCLGGTLYKLLTGKIPYRDRRRDAGDAPVPMDKTVPRALQAIVNKAMEIDPHDRYTSAKDLAEDVEQWLADEPVSVYREPVTERLVRWSRRHRGWTVSIALFVLLSLIVVAVAAAVLGVTAESERQAKVDAQHARSQAEESTKRGIRIAAKFASRSVAFEIDRRWRVLEKEASSETLRALIKKMAPPSDQATRDAAQQELLLWIRQRRDAHAHTATSACWFINDKAGFQIARAPYRESVGKNYRYRDYFHGKGYDVKPEEADGLLPIRAPHRSNVFISTNTNAQMVAFSVPIWDDPNDPQSSVLGILAMAVELAEFTSLQLDQGQVAVLADTNPESRTMSDRPPRRGLIVHHPHLLTLRLAGNVRDASKLNFYLPPERVSDLLALRSERLKHEQQRHELDFPSPQAAPVETLFDDNYQDPIGGPYEGRWLAAFEPVLVYGENEIHDTGWIVIVQERKESKSD